MLEPRAQEVAEQLRAMPYVLPVDELGVLEVGKMVAMVEAIDSEIERVGLDGPESRVRWLLEIRLRASRRMMEALDRYAATPTARAQFLRDFARGKSLAADIAKKRREAEREPQP